MSTTTQQTTMPNIRRKRTYEPTTGQYRLVRDIAEQFSVSENRVRNWFLDELCVPEEVFLTWYQAHVNK